MKQVNRRLAREEIMVQWDSWRQYIAEGGGGSWPRDALEAVLDNLEEYPLERDSVLYEIITKLVGAIDPIGESHVDEQRLENLEVMIGLVDKLVYDIDSVASNKERVEHSMKQAGELADKFLTDLGIVE